MPISSKGVHSPMKITPDLFEAFLKCPTKCWLRSNGEPASGNEYAEWVKAQNESYRKTATERLMAKTSKQHVSISPLAQDLKAAKWLLATGCAVEAQLDYCLLETQIHAVERIPTTGPGKPAQFIPI